MTTKNDIRIPVLSQEDKKFIDDIAMKFELSIDELESIMAELIASMRRLYNFFELEDDFLENIDYKGRLSQKESDVLKTFSRVIVSQINGSLKVSKFRKCVIAGLTIIHFKIDKYERILSYHEYDQNPTDSAQDYHHYLWDRMKYKFKRLKDKK